MSSMKPILSLVTDGNGQALTSFITSTPEQWANEQMSARYSTVRQDGDDPNSFPIQCWKHLRDEYEMLRSWFTPDGKLNLTLQSASVNNKLTGPIGNGIGFDFKTNGDPEYRMRYFKSVLLSASRTAAILPPEDRHSGSAQFGGLIKVIAGAYTMRAEIHRWRTLEHNDITYSPADMSRRWVALQTYSFILRLGADNRKWAWEASKCQAIFGPFDDTDIT